MRMVGAGGKEGIVRLQGFSTAISQRKKLSPVPHMAICIKLRSHIGSVMLGKCVHAIEGIDIVLCPYKLRLRPAIDRWPLDLVYLGSQTRHYGSVFASPCG